MKAAHSEWKSYKLAQICCIEIGKTPSRGNAAYWDVERKTNNIWLSIADIPTATYPSVSDSKEYISNEGARLCKIIKKGTLLVSFKLTIGRMAITGRDLYSNEAIAALKNINDDLLTTKYLYWYLMFFDWKKYAENDEKLKGITLNKAKLKEIVIKISSRETQNRIVAILDDAFERIDKAIANTEKNIANAKELFEVILNSAFDKINHKNKSVSISNLCESIIDCVNKTAPTVSEVTPFKMIRTTNIKNGTVKLDVVKFVSEETYAQWTRRQVPQYGDVLLTREAPMGEVGILLSSDTVFLGQRIVSYRVDSDKASNWYLYYALQSKQVREQMNKVASGATVQHIRVPDVNKWMIPFPQLQVQNTLVDTLRSAKENTYKIGQLYNTKLASLHALKQSLLAAAFSGELTADFNPEALEDDL